jgi:predicted GNAT family N-acyltransferase
VAFGYDKIKLGGRDKLSRMKGLTNVINVKIYNGLVIPAKMIRKEVFINEQGFNDEFDDIDSISVHLVAFDENENPIATCRIFNSGDSGTYILGRLAVLKEHRGKNVGADMINAAEKYILDENGKNITLHSQCRVKEFYRNLGFSEYGEVDDDEGCPHIWMKKQIHT